MTPAPGETTMAVVGADRLDALRPELLDVYTDAYADRIAVSDFYAPDRYWERVTAYASRTGFALATARTGNQLVGYALGFRLPADTGWWKHLRTPVDPTDIAEDGTRTFAVNELMVRPAYRGRGHGRRLHDALLSDRPEQRATLLVRPDNEPARPAYIRWGWRKLGEIQPFPDAPVYDAMVLELR